MSLHIFKNTTILRRDRPAKVGQSLQFSLYTFAISNLTVISVFKGISRSIPKWKWPVRYLRSGFRIGH